MWILWLFSSSFDSGIPWDSMWILGRIFMFLQEKKGRWDFDRDSTDAAFQLFKIFLIRSLIWHELKFVKGAGRGIPLFESLFFPPGLQEDLCRSTVDRAMTVSRLFSSVTFFSWVSGAPYCCSCMVGLIILYIRLPALLFSRLFDFSRFCAFLYQSEHRFVRLTSVD